jgi:hypothetical protein
VVEESAAGLYFKGLTTFHNNISIYTNNKASHFMEIAENYIKWDIANMGCVLWRLSVIGNMLGHDPVF